MKISKEMIERIKKSKTEKELVLILREIIREYENLDRDDMSVINDIVGMLRGYGWAYNKQNKHLSKEGQIDINLYTISFK